MELLRKRMWYTLLLIIAGIALLVVSLRCGVESDSTNAFAITLVVAGAVRLVRYYRIWNNPDQMKRYIILQKEERLISIAEKSGRLTFSVTISVQMLALFYFFFIGQESIAQKLSFIMAAQMLLYVAIFSYLRKKY